MNCKEKGTKLRPYRVYMHLFMYLIHLLDIIDSILNFCINSTLWLTFVTAYSYAVMDFEFFLYLLQSHRSLATLQWMIVEEKLTLGIHPVVFL